MASIIRLLRVGVMALTILAGLVGVSPSFAAPPHPDLVQQISAGEIEEPFFLANLASMHSKGICTGSEADILDRSSGRSGDGQIATATGPFRVLALMIEFSDHPSTVGATFYDSLLFGTVGSTVRDYFGEVSYGQLDLLTVNLPSSLGWKSAPRTYAYYVDGQNGTGSYPRNSQRLVEDAVDMVDPLVNFSDYDNDGNGTVDVLLVIHSGTGAEYSGSNNDIWSHQWSITPRSKDGVSIRNYTVQPEFWSDPGDMTIGVYAHELAHGFGLPDLYDTDGNSNGIGNWGLMSQGAWNGPRSLGSSPAHPCAWTRVRMGFAQATNVPANTLGQPIINIESTPQVYRLQPAGGPPGEFFLVENRQRTGYDSYLPQDGLLIWHIDESISDNTQQWWPGSIDSVHFLVALEQADGLFNLEHRNNRGDAGDPYPGTSDNRLFGPASSPNSDMYVGGPSLVTVGNISESGPTMYADFLVSLSSGGVEDPPEEPLPTRINLAQNYPNPFNPETNISYSIAGGGRVRLEVFNILGRRVKTLIDEYQADASGQIAWDATDESGHTASSGIYFYRLSVGDHSQTKRMVLLR